MDSSLPIHADEQWVMPYAQPTLRAFAEVYEAYFDQIYSYVRYQVPDDSTADDVTAQIFERTLTSFDKYNPRKGEFVTWLFGVARNVVRENQRKRWSQRSVSLEQIGELRAVEHLPEEVVLRQEENDHLLAAVARLRQREREIVALKFGAGLTNRNIARLLNLSESNVGTILYRTLRRLRDMLDTGEGLYG